MHSVLVCSHTDRNTGFGRIARGIASSLSGAYNVHVVGLGPDQENDTWSGHTHHRHDPTRTTALSELAPKLNPAAIILIGQGQLLAWQVTRLRRDGYTGVVIPYVPMEGPVRDAAPLADMLDATRIVAYTGTGAIALGDALKTTKKTGQTVPSISVIPHAIDNLAPSITIDRLELRLKMFPQFAQRSSGIWLLNANRNDFRKQPELTMAAFAQAELPEATLVLHCNPDRQGMNLRAVRDRLRLQDSVIFTHDLYPDLLTEEQLTQLYACCDIGINTALAEGWGLIAFEHARHNTAQIMPAHEGLQEIWGDAPLWVPVGEKTPVDYVFSGQKPDTEKLSAAIHYLVTNEQARQEIAERCAAHANDPIYEWETVGNMWMLLVGMCIEDVLVESRKTKVQSRGGLVL